MKKITVLMNRGDNMDRFMFEAWLLNRGISYRTTSAGNIKLFADAQTIEDIKDAGYGVIEW